MLSPGALRTNLLVKLGEATGRTHVLPIVLLAPTGRCNSRCLSCDWWRADGAGELSLAEIGEVVAALPAFGTRLVALTGGEPLVRPDVMAIADLVRARGIDLHLLTSGLALERHAQAIAARFREVTISLDGHTAELYRAIRGVAGLAAVAGGVAALRAAGPGVAISARSTLHRHNFRHVGELIVSARRMGVGRISFLAADVGNNAFNREPGTQPPNDLLLAPEEVDEFAEIIEAVIRRHAADIADGRVAPGPEGLRRIVGYYRAHASGGAFPPVACNAPWASVVIEADGTVRPCFFHAPVGNVRERPLADILNGALPAFRRTLDVATDPTCRRCVCTLRVGLRARI